MVHAVLILPLLIIAGVLLLGLLLIVAHILPHIAGLLATFMVVAVLVVLFSASFRHEAQREMAVKPQVGKDEGPPNAAKSEAAMRSATRRTPDGEAKGASPADNSGIQSRTFNPDGSDAKPVDQWGPKPEWVDKAPHFEQQAGSEIYVATATAGPYSTAAECDRELEGEIDRVAQTYVERKLGSGVIVRLEPQFADDHLIRARWRENVNVSVGNMQSAHALLIFDPSVQTELQRLWRQAVVGPRLAYAAAGLSGLLLLVGSVYSVLKWGPGAKQPRAT